ncbi:MAG: DUF7289 family protein [Candidatus Natronoplasma sp.]
MAGLRRKMESSDGGVATTVGTIMALLIFLSILSLITQQYVPVWMEDTEAYHMDEVKGQFADLKSGIDSMVINERTDYPLYSSINLGTAGIPLFAGSSPGRLTFSPHWNDTHQDEGMHVSFYDTDDGELVSFRSSGNISYHAINREFEDQTLIYEHGSIILEQSDGEIMRARPQISIEEVDVGEYEISATMIHLDGSSRDLSGTSRVGVTTELVGTRSYIYSDIENFTWSLTTAYPRLWSNYINNETDAETSINGNVVDISLPDVGDNKIDLDIRRVKVEVEIER